MENEVVESKTVESIVEKFKGNITKALADSLVKREPIICEGIGCIEVFAYDFWDGLNDIECQQGEVHYLCDDCKKLPEKSYCSCTPKKKRRMEETFEETNKEFSEFYGGSNIRLAPIFQSNSVNNQK